MKPALILASVLAFLLGVAPHWFVCIEGRDGSASWMTWSSLLNDPNMTDAHRRSWVKNGELNRNQVAAVCDRESIRRGSGQWSAKLARDGEAVFRTLYDDSVLNVLVKGGLSRALVDALPATPAFQAADMQWLRSGHCPIDVWGLVFSLEEDPKKHSCDAVYWVLEVAARQPDWEEAPLSTFSSLEMSERSNASLYEYAGSCTRRDLYEHAWLLAVEGNCDLCQRRLIAFGTNNSVYGKSEVLNNEVRKHAMRHEPR